MMIALQGLILFVLGAVSEGFLPLAAAPTLHNQHTNFDGVALELQSSRKHNSNTVDNNSMEVSRRVALVTAAAIAAGVSPAYAATLEKQVAGLEKSNLAEVNTKGAPEKHLPKVSVDGTTVQVVVPHVMDPEKPHYIEFVWLKDMKSNKVVAVQSFAATDASPPTLTATGVKSGSTVKPLLYCNLHGLWEGEVLTV